MKKIDAIFKRKFLFFAGFGDHFFFVNSGGELMGAGLNSLGQLAIGKPIFKEKKINIRNLSNFGNRQYFSPQYVDIPHPIRQFEMGTKRFIRKISVGRFHTLFLTVGDGVYAAGDDDHCQLSLGPGGVQQVLAEGCFRALPIVIEKEEEDEGEAEKRGESHVDQDPIVDVHAGLSTSFFITRSGRVLSCGANIDGQCGCRGPKGKYSSGYSDINIQRACEVKNLYGIKQVSTGVVRALSLFGNRFGHDYDAAGEYTLFLANDGGLYTCGKYVFSGKKSYRRPVRIKFFKRKEVALARMVPTLKSCFFITQDRRVFASGENVEAEFGNGTKGRKNERLPVECKQLSNFDLMCHGKTDRFLVFKKEGKFFGTGAKSGVFGLSDKFGITRLHPYNKFGVTYFSDDPVFSLSPKNNRKKKKKKEKNERGFFPLEIPDLSLISDDIAEIVTGFDVTFVITKKGRVLMAGKNKMKNCRGRSRMRFVALEKVEVRKTLQLDMFEKWTRIKYLLEKMELLSLCVSLCVCVLP